MYSATSVKALSLHRLLLNAGFEATVMRKIVKDCLRDLRASVVKFPISEDLSPQPSVLITRLQFFLCELCASAVTLSPHRWIAVAIGMRETTQPCSLRPPYLWCEIGVLSPHPQHSLEMRQSRKMFSLRTLRLCGEKFMRSKSRNLCLHSAVPSSGTVAATGKTCIPSVNSVSLW